MNSTASPLASLFQKHKAEFRDFCDKSLPYSVSGLEKELEAIAQGALVLDGSDRAWIEMRGIDAPDFLQRILTSDVRKLQPGQGQWSAMLDGKGHWIADLLLYALPEPDNTPFFGIDVPSIRLEAVLQKLEMMHFGEQLEWSAPDVGRILLLGFEKEGEASKISVEAQAQGWLLQRPDRGAKCLDRVIASDAAEDFAKTLLDGGASLGGWQTLEQLRIENFRARWGADFDTKTTLPNSNEWDRSCIEKGCYAGQEVIAKINTYGEAPRQLCHLRFEAKSVNLTGAELQDADGRKMGKVTSWAWSEFLQEAVGLGILRRRAAVEDGTVFAVLPKSSVKPIAALVHLPTKIFG